MEKTIQEDAGEFVIHFYDELRKLARARLRKLGKNETLQTTELVHEVLIQLNKSPNERYDEAKYFFGAAAQNMNQVLVDRHRRRSAQRRGGDQIRVELNEELDQPDANLGHPGQVERIAPEDRIALLAALEQLNEISPERAAIAMLRYAGLTHLEIAQALGCSTRTSERAWRTACAWLATQLRDI